MVYGCKQANKCVRTYIRIHTHEQCSFASVGLAQARPNDGHHEAFKQVDLTYMHVRGGCILKGVYEQVSMIQYHYILPQHILYYTSMTHLTHLQMVFKIWMICQCC